MWSTKLYILDSYLLWLNIFIRNSYSYLNAVKNLWFFWEFIWREQSMLLWYHGIMHNCGAGPPLPWCLKKCSALFEKTKNNWTNRDQTKTIGNGIVQEKWPFFRVTYTSRRIKTTSRIRGVNNQGKDSLTTEEDKH